MTGALLNRRIRDHVEALIAAGEEGDRLPTMGELRRRFGGASNGAVQQALEPLKASGAIVTTRGPHGGHFIGPATEPRNILGELRAQLDTAAAGLRAAYSLVGELGMATGAWMLWAAARRLLGAALAHDLDALLAQEVPERLVLAQHEHLQPLSARFVHGRSLLPVTGGVFVCTDSRAVGDPGRVRIRAPGAEARALGAGRLGP